MTNYCGSKATLDEQPCRKHVSMPGAHCFLHPRQAATPAASTIAASAPVTPMATPGHGPTTVAEFDAELRSEIAGPLPADPTTGWARDFVYCNRATNVMDYAPDLDATAYLTQYHRGTNIIDRSYCAVAGSSYHRPAEEGPTYPFEIAESRQVYARREDGSDDQDFFGQEDDCADLPGPRGFATEEEAMAEARRMALTDMSSAFGWAVPYYERNQDATRG